MHVDRAKQKAGAGNGVMRVQFSAPVKAAFADLAASVHFSNDFDPDIRSVLRQWAEQKALNIRDILLAFPAIAEEVFGHIRATGDERASEAWTEIRNQMAENGFTLLMTHSREK
jgi:hypothetical protein